MSAKAKKTQPAIKEYQARNLLDVAELFFADQANAKKFAEWKEKQEHGDRKRSMA